MNALTIRASTLALAALLLVTPPAFAGPSLQKHLAAIAEHIAADPQNPSLYLRRALVHSDSAHNSLALKDVATAERMGGVTAGTQLTRGILYYRIGKFAEALRRFDQALKTKPDHLVALSYRSRLLRDMQQTNAALADYRRLIALNPAVDAGHYVSAATLMLKAKDQGPTAALQLLDQRIAQVGAIPQLQRFAIGIEADRGNHAGVIARLNTLDARSKASPAWMIEMGEWQLRTCRRALAMQHFETAESQLKGRRATVANTQLRQKLAVLLKESVGADCGKRA